MQYKLTIPGEPVAKSRPRVTRYGTYTPAKTVNYENFTKQLWYMEHGQTMLENPLSMQVKAYFTIPKSTSKKNRAKMIAEEIRPTKKPDGDNILKIIADALNKAAYVDDKQLVKMSIEKYYSENPRVELTLEEIWATRNSLRKTEMGL